MGVTARDERLGCAVAFVVAAVIAGLCLWELYDFLAPL